MLDSERAQPRARFRRPGAESTAPAPDPLTLSGPGPALNADVFFMATQYALSVKKASVFDVAALKALGQSR